jgi:hypothetical protein
MSAISPTEVSGTERVRSVAATLQIKTGDRQDDHLRTMNK